MAKDCYGTDYGTYGGTPPTACGTILVRDSTTGQIVESQWMGYAVKK
jgi:hypothetical protein